jgi:hypothetical protein
MYRLHNRAEISASYTSPTLRRFRVSYSAHAAVVIVASSLSAAHLAAKHLGIAAARMNRPLGPIQLIRDLGPLTSSRRIGHVSNYN